MVDWMYHSKGEGIDKGPHNLDVERWVKGLEFSKTQVVVLDLVSNLLLSTPSSSSKYIVWIDNLFTSVKLLS